MTGEAACEQCHRGLQQEHNGEQDGLYHKSGNKEGSQEAMKGNQGVSSSQLESQQQEQNVVQQQ